MEDTYIALKQAYRMREEELSDTKRASNKLKNFISEWNQLDRMEKRLLEEVAYFSQGTVAQRKAIQELDRHLDESRSTYQVFEHLEDTYQQSEKKLRKKMESIEAEIHSLREEEQHAKD